jgi:hypothetical protein
MVDSAASEVVEVTDLRVRGFLRTSVFWNVGFDG